MQTLDQHFQYFYEKNGFGPAEFVQQVSEDVVGQYRGKLPEQILSYWQTFGFCSFGKGLFWTVNPGDYASLVSMWLAGTDFVSKDTFYVLGRSAFGALYLWGTKSGPSLMIDCPWGMIFPNDQTAAIAAGKDQFLAQRFFGGRKKAPTDQEDEHGKLLFDRALRSLGQLETGEMYGFEPALALGGRPDLKNLRRVEAVSHLTILAGLGERKLMRDIVQDAQRAGLMK